MNVNSDASAIWYGFCRPYGTRSGCDVNPRVETRGYFLSSLRDSIRTRRESRFLLSLTEPDVCVTRIRGLKAGAILFRPFGTQFARGATTCPRSNRRAATGGCPYARDPMGGPEGATENSPGQVTRNA